jgi:hypothetical protein
MGNSGKIAIQSMFASVVAVVVVIDVSYLTTLSQLSKLCVK